MTAPGYHRAGSLEDAARLGARPRALFLAGGTEVSNWLRDGLTEPDHLVDLGDLGLDGIERDGGSIRIGAGSRLADIAADPLVRTVAPALAQAIDQSASPAIRSMSTLAGNLLQHTRCGYYRGGGQCNRRRPGSGCAALAGDSRFAGILGTDHHCVAVHPSDAAVALTALDAELAAHGPGGRRTFPLGALYAPDSLARSTLAPGEVITEVRIPETAAARTGHYRKVRDRASFDFALVSAAGHQAAENGRTVALAIALGGVAPRPWRCRTAEAFLVGQPLSEAAVRAALAAELSHARPLPGNAFKLELVVGVVLRLFSGDLVR